MKFVAPIIAFAVAAQSCNLPRDPEHTLNRVTNGVIRVGYAVDSPWVTDAASSPGGIEAKLVNDLAHSLNARVAWVRGSDSKILKALKMRELDLAIGGFEKDSPWSTEVAFTRPYYQETHVLAAPQGENAWLMRVEKHLSSHKVNIPILLQSPQ